MMVNSIELAQHLFPLVVSQLEEAIIGKNNRIARYLSMGKDDRYTRYSGWHFPQF